jgi:hypothetical protein
MGHDFISIGERYEILQAAENVEEEIWKDHIGLFIQSFIVSEKRQRWLNLCLEKPNVQDKSHKMHNDLNRNLCVQMGREVKEAFIKRKGRGIYYEFSGEARWLFPQEALLVGYGQESIFSLHQGEVAVYFWHEMREYLCQRSQDRVSRP